MSALLPDIKELAALLRLLDDETPEVRSVVVDKLSHVGGDLSEILPDVATNLNTKELDILEDILRTVRRKTLREEWLTPRFGSAALEDDWELFESQLRLLSDFLHDGISLRQPLSDALDLLTEEFQSTYPIGATENDLRIFLFEEGRLRGNHKHYYDPRNGDLAWCISSGISNPIGLGVIYMLLGQRLVMDIQGISFPGHFLCRIFEDAEPIVVDCFDRGKMHAQHILTDPMNELTHEQRLHLQEAADLGTILMRLLNNLIDAFRRANRKEDMELLTEMRDSMAKQK
ncbi:MAG: transglutaminase family protein [Verrucomicrobiota bacterium]